MDVIKQFFAYYKPWRKLFWLDFGCAIISGLLELAFPLAVAYFIDDLLPGGDFRDWDDIEAWATHIAHELTAGGDGPPAP